MLRTVGVPVRTQTQKSSSFLCVFASLREPFAPLARPQRAMLRGRYRVVLQSHYGVMLLNCLGSPSTAGGSKGSYDFMGFRSILEH